VEAQPNSNDSRTNAKIPFMSISSFLLVFPKTLLERAPSPMKKISFLDAQSEIADRLQEERFEGNREIGQEFPQENYWH
jgi:hypothetical protein